MRALALALALVLPGCLPVAMLRPPEPARGAEFSLGATLMPNPFGGQSPVLLLPYLAHAEGTGPWSTTSPSSGASGAGSRWAWPRGWPWTRASPSRPPWARWRTGAGGCPWSWTGGHPGRGRLLPLAQASPPRGPGRGVGVGLPAFRGGLRRGLGGGGGGLGRAGDERGPLQPLRRLAVWNRSRSALSLSRTRSSHPSPWPQRG